ncbi:MAG: class I SAM-dependent methyltransferase [Glaciimonas sp.]|nr:class I SAM-dependent methyltransferase [Glaciimonas sp.]
MTQNIYDNDAFFDGYGQLERSISGLDGAPEWPALRALMPDLHGRKVLDLGCGYGWFSRWANENGAASVLGLDVSEKMLERARLDTQENTHTNAQANTVTYAIADLDNVHFSPAAYDFVYSSLTLHYLKNLDKLFAQIHSTLTPDGSFVFSAEHPMTTAPDNPGWMKDEKGGVVWPVNHYLNEGTRTTDWLAPGVIKQHRTIATYLNLLIAAGFTITHVEEWGPSEEQMAARPDWCNERHRPFFLLVRAQR